MAKRKPSATKKARHTVYKTENRYAKNRINDIEKHLKSHPNDLVAARAAKSTPTYRRSRNGGNTPSNLQKPKPPVFSDNRKTMREQLLPISRYAK